MNALIPLLLVLLSTGRAGCWCASYELERIKECAQPYALDFYFGIGTGSSCNRNWITYHLCNLYGTIVRCVNAKSLSSTSCRPYMVRQINAALPLACNLYHFMGTCSNAPSINQGGYVTRSIGCPQTKKLFLSTILLQLSVWWILK